MRIFLSLKSAKPLYEQIQEQIKRLIIEGKLASDEQLPSIRNLSKELQVGVITVKRAYDELVKEGFLISKEAVGYFVANFEVDDMIRNDQEKIKEEFIKIINKAKKYKINANELITLLKGEYNDARGNQNC